MDPSELTINDSRVRELFFEVWMSGRVREGILLFVTCSLLLCMGSLWMFSALGKKLASFLGISTVLAHAFALIFGWILLVSVNGWWFPLSNYSIPFSALHFPIVGKVILGLFVALLVVIVCRAFPSITWKQWLGLSCIAVGGMGFWMVGGISHVKPQYGRNIIFIGVDSLSADAFAKTAEQTPILHALYEKSVRYNRAYTPLGRTYPSWVSILSGKHPQQHGAVFNLRSLDHVDTAQLLSTELQARNYRTVFAIDERRFNNLNERFGFDAIVGPRAGVLDFVLQYLADTPLTNVLLQTSLAKWLFPYSYLNTASYTNYSNVDFVQSVLGAVSGGGNIFLAVHFESAHFPYKTRHAQVDVKSSNDLWDLHVEALSSVDQQVAMLMEGLKRQGALDDALVVLLSDHGESLGEVERVVTVDGQPLTIGGYGHGVNLLSDRQSRVLLATLTYKNGRIINTPSSIATQVGLTDLRKAVEDYLEGGKPLLKPAGVCMMVETGIRFSAAENYKTLNGTILLQQAANYYEVNTNGMMQLREDWLPELVAKKDIGIRCLDRISYYAASTGRIDSFELDEQGLPVKQITPPDEDVARIELYRRTYSQQFPILENHPAMVMQ